MRSFLLGSLLLSTLVACAASGEDGASSTQNDTAASTPLLDGPSYSYQQVLAAAGATGPTAAAIVFPSSGDPAIYGQLVAGGKVTVVYALNRLSQCRATHDGFQIWDTRLGGAFSNGTQIGEESGDGSNGQPAGSLRTFVNNVAESAPVTFDVPEGAESISLYAHNTSPAGPSPACDSYDSKNSANFTFKVEGSSTVGIDDGSNADANALDALVDIGDGSTTAAILFGKSGQPVVKGNLVQGGKVYVAFALDRLPQCRATHDGWPFWVTQIGGQFSDGTQVGEASSSSNGFNDVSVMPGHVVRFTQIPNRDGATAQAVPTEFTIPATATDLAVWAHNWNPGGPTSPCSSFDSLGGANYHFSIQTK